MFVTRDDARRDALIACAFDEWRTPKCRNGYNILFEEWAEKDMRAFVRRDRNHPSVIMWSIGNEIPDQRSEDGGDLAAFLCRFCREEDGIAALGFDRCPRPFREYLHLHDAAVGIGSRTVAGVEIVRMHELELRLLCATKIQGRGDEHCIARIWR